MPVATYTGWNLRDPSIGNPDLFIGITGGLAGWTLPLPGTSADQASSGDPRPSIDELYRSREDYLQKVQDAAQSLVDEGYMLEEDIDGVMERAGLRFDYFTAQANGGRFLNNSLNRPRIKSLSVPL